MKEINGEGQDKALLAALQRLIAGQPAADDLPLLRQAVAEGRISLAGGESGPTVGSTLTGSTVLAANNQTVSQSGGVNFGQSNQIQISGSVIGTMTLNLPNAAEAARLLESLRPYRPDQQPPPDSLPEPGVLPPGARLPFPRNAVFTGREADLIALASSLLHAGQSIVLSGTGGVGKTQLAVEFCYRYGRFFHGLHWLHADQDMLAEISACGLAMGLSPWPETLPEQVQATLQAWARVGPRLVVLDNMDDAALLQEWLPRLPQARVLVTSRLRDWPPDLGLALHLLDSLPRSHSLALLRKLAPRLASSTDSDLDAVAERLGDLPLALDLAGRYLGDRRGLSVTDFLGELEKAGSVLAHSALRDWTEHNPTRHATDLAATFLLSWDKLASSGESSARQSQSLFCASGYCAANTPIPWEVFYIFSGAEDGKAQAAVDKSLGELEDIGLLSLADSGPVIHRLLAEFARLQDGAAEASSLPGLAEALAWLSNKANQSGFPDHFKPLRAHVEVAAGWAEAGGLELSGYLWNEFGYHLMQVAEYAGAQAAYERALGIVEAIYGPDHPEVSTRINNIGAVLREQGNYAGAKAAFERALHIDEAAFGPDSPQVAMAVNNLGSALQDLGDLSGAQAAYERGLRIVEAAVGPDHPQVATIVNNLGLVLKNSGDLAGARAAYERALRIDETTYGPDHPKVATSVNNLGEVLREQGEFAAAKACFERSLRIDEAAFGPDHPNVARDVNSLGGALQALGDNAGAKVAFERGLHIQESAFGPGHPMVAVFSNNVGSTLQALGDNAGAQAAYERALHIAEDSLGPEHPDVAIYADNLGAILKVMQDYPGAKAAYEQALRVDETVFGPDHPVVAVRVNRLGMLLREMGDLAGARAALERGLRIDEAAFGPDDLKVARDVNNLGMLLEELGDLAGARSAYSRALAISEKSLTSDHPNLLTVRANLEGLT